MINVYVNSPEQVSEVTESAKSLAEILKGGVVTEMPDDIREQIQSLFEGKSCNCSGCQMKRRIEALGAFTDGVDTFENLGVALDKYGFINKEMDRDDLINIINEYAATIEEGGQIEIGEGKFLKPVSAVTH